MLLNISLTAHPHVHCIVPGGGLSPEGYWINCRPGFFLPVRVLSRFYRRNGPILRSRDCVMPARCGSDNVPPLGLNSKPVDGRGPINDFLRWRG